MGLHSSSTMAWPNRPPMRLPSLLRLPSLMRLRLAHMLSLLLVGAVTVAVVGMGMASAWNLQHGFGEYIAARDAEQLERFALMVEATLADSGGVEGLRARRMDLRWLVREFEHREGRDPVAETRPPPGRPLPLDPPDGFLRRLAMVTPDGRPLLSRPLPERHEGLTQRLLRWNGAVVAALQMVPAPPVPDSVQADFLHSQYWAIAAVALALWVVSLFGAHWVAGRWVRPLLAVQATASRLARGELTARLQEDRSGAGRSAEIDDVVRNINRMAEGLQTLEGARRRWLAEISHELRTPLTVLRGEIEALIDGVRPLRPEALASLQHETARLSRLVDDLHLLALSDLRALPCHRLDLDAVPLLRAAVDRAGHRAAARGLTLEARLPTDPVQVCWDAERISQLLDNLLENSIRYTDAPGRVRLTLQGDPQSDSVTLVIEDSAPAVPVGDLPRLFEPLYRADQARSRLHGGSGLGLSICQAIAQAHEGSIDAGLSLLGGLQVRVRLPSKGHQP